MTRTFAAAIFALFAVTAPAHAAYVDTLDANLNLNFGSSENLTGELALQWQPIVTGCCRDNDYTITSSNLSLNGSPINLTGIGPNAFPSTIGIYYSPPTDIVPLGLNTNFLPPNPTYANFTLNFTHGTSGTVTINSETLATPLPAALPLFASALAGLGGFGRLKRRGKVSSRCTGTARRY